MSYRKHMRDTCRIGTPGTALNGNPMPSYTYGTTTRCRHTKQTIRDTANGSQFAPTDVQIRVPRSTTVTSKDRVNLTALNGNAVDEYFAIVGEPWETLGEIVLDCQRVSAQGASAK